MGAPSTASDNVLDLTAVLGNVLMGEQKSCEFSDLKQSAGAAYSVRKKVPWVWGAEGGAVGTACWEVRMDTSSSAGSAVL